MLVSTMYKVKYIQEIYLEEINMKKTVAVLLTVFNRKDITLKGLSTLYAAMKPVEDKYSFDVYMTNDGCTDVLQRL